MATRAANTLRYSLMNIFILVGIVAIAFGGPFGFTGLVFSFVLIGYVDELFGDAGNKEEMPPDLVLPGDAVPDAAAADLCNTRHLQRHLA